jgi:hypothetical protein
VGGLVYICVVGPQSYKSYFYFKPKQIDMSDLYGEQYMSEALEAVLDELDGFDQEELAHERELEVYFFGEPLSEDE